MTRTRRLPHWLMILTFVVGQLLAVVHATQHQAVEHGGGGCQVCAQADAAPLLPQIGQAPLPAATHQDFVLTAAPEAADGRPFDRPNSRGPPAQA